MTQGHDQVLMRTLQETASSLSGLNAVYSPAAQPLLPETVKLGGKDPSLQQQPVRVVGGALTSTNQGLTADHVLHVDADHLHFAVLLCSVAAALCKCVLKLPPVCKVRA